MKLLFEESFLKDLKKINDRALRHKIFEIIKHLKTSNTISEIRNIKKLHNKKNYFRIRLGNYRIGLEIIGDTIIFVRILHRKDIYKYFP